MMSKRGNSRDLRENACTRACTHSRPPGLRQTVRGEAVSPAPLQLWVCRFFLLQSMLGALRHSLLNLSHPKNCPGLWLQSKPPLWDLPIRKVHGGGCHAVSS